MSVARAGHIATSIGEELADRGGDLLDVGLQGKVTGVDETNVGVGDVALERLDPAGKKNGSFLPHTASRGGLLVRKYSWNAG
jgi:hypothetical protein